MPIWRGGCQWHMLAAQLAATELAVLVGFVDGDALVFAPGALTRQSQ